MFLVINIVPHIGMAVIQANESREQTEFKKICDEIPVNYEVQLSDFNNEVSTECIYITKPDLMNRYYNERRELYSDLVLRISVMMN